MSSNDPTGQEAVVYDPQALKALDKLNTDQKRQAREIAHRLDVKDSNAVLAFGTDPQRRVASAMEPALQQARMKDTGEVGGLLTDLLHQTRQIDPSVFQSLTGGGGFLSKVPGIGQLFDKIQRYREQFDTVSKRIEQIKSALEAQGRVLARDIGTLDKAYNENSQFYDALLVWIAAGEIKLQQLHEDQAAALQKAQGSGDPHDAQVAADLTSLIDRIERRIYDLKLTAVISTQTGPQIRMVQQADQALAEKIQSSLLIVLPLWVQQMTLALSLVNLNKAAKLQEEVTDTTEKLLAANREMLHTGVTSVAKQMQQGVVSIEALQDTQASLVQTIEETLQIAAEGKKQRELNEGKLDQLTTQIGQQLTQIQAPNK